MPQTLQIIERESKPPTMLARLARTLRSFTLPALSLKDPALAKLFGAGARSSAGIVVTPEMAFTFSAVLDAVSQISSDVAKLPLIHKKRRQDGGSDDYTDSKIYRLLKDEANPDMSAMVFRRTILAHALTSHGGYAEIERDGADRPSALWPLTPDRVQPFVDRTSLANGRYRSRLRYRIDGGPTILESRDVLHIHGLGYDGYMAYPLIDKARHAIGLALAAEQFGSKFFANGSTFGGVLSTAQPLSEDAQTVVRKSIEDYHASAEKAHRLLVIGGGWEYTRMGVAPNEAQMDALRDKQVEEVARFFNMPLFKLKLAKPGAVSYASTEMADLDYYKSCLLTWIVLCEQEFNRKLIPSLEARQQFIKHNVNAFMRADATARKEFYAAMLDRGVFCADDVLDLEDMNPQPDGQGKMYLVQGAMVPKDKVAAIADATIKKNSTPKVTLPPPAPAADDAADRATAEAIARAERAEAAAAAARADADTARDARIAAEASSQATAEEVRALRANEERHAQVAAHATALAESLRADLVAAGERERVAASELDDERARRRAERVELEAAVSAASAASEQARTEVADLRARLDAAQSVSQAYEAEIREATTRETAQADTVAALERARADAARSVLDLTERLAAAEVADTQSRGEVSRLSEELAMLRTDLDALRASVAEGDVAVRAASDERDRLAAVVTESERALGAMRLAQASESQAHAERLAALEAAAATAARERDEAQQQLETAIQRHEAVRYDLDVARASSQADANRLRDLESRLAAAEADVLAQREQVAVRTAERDTAAAVRASYEAVEQERIRELCASVERAQHEIASVSAAHAAARERVTALQDDQARLEAALTDAERARVAAELERDEIRRADVEGMSAVVAAHRALVCDVVRRMLDREMERARRAQASTEKMRQHLSSFYDGFADLMHAALLPAIRVHLAFIRSVEDPSEATRRVVHDHIETSRRQIVTVLDGDADELAASLAGLFHRWEQDRVTMIADRLMEEELRYARSL